ncbi:hypothetical protein ACUUMA_09490 [Paenarthrobacter nitroguajacolicus]
MDLTDGDKNGVEYVHAPRGVALQGEHDLAGYRHGVNTLVGFGTRH